MQIKPAVARIAAALSLLGALLGSLPAQQRARAAPSLQAGTEGWGILDLPAPTRAHLDLSEARAALDAAAPAVKSDATTLDNNLLAEDPPLDPTDLTVFYNHPFTGATSSFSPNSPTAANDGKVIMATYNEYLVLSDDYGASWFEVDPLFLLADTLVDPGFDGDHAGFSGHQETLFDPTHDLLFWLVHFDPDETGNNLQLGVSRDAGSNWFFYQFRPDSIGPPPGNDADWFEQPHMVLTSNYVYILSDAFRWPTAPPASPEYSSVIRISLDSLDAGDPASFTFYYSETHHGFAAADGGTDTLYFAAHADSDTMKIYVWPESSGPPPTAYNVDHADFDAPATYACPVGDTGVDPCAALDDRITAGWLRSDLDQLGFMWTAPQGDDAMGSHAFPYIRTLVVDVSAVPPTFEANVATGDAEMALFLPSAGVNARGHVGGNYSTAGGLLTNDLFPQCNVWIYDDITGSSFAMGSPTVVTSGDSNPGTPTWGLYSSTRMNGLNPFQWIGSCYSMESSVAEQRVLRFGRERDADTIVSIAGIVEGARNLQAWESTSIDFPDRNDGPVAVVQTEGLEILSSQQLSWKVGGVYKSVSETMGLPEAQLTDTYYLPWYAHSVWVDTEIRIANVGSADSSVTVTINDTTYGPYLVHPNQTKRPKFPGVVDGPVTVAGTAAVPLVVSERMAWKVAGNVTTVADMIALPDNQLTDAYSFPWYVQNLIADTELRIANVGGGSSSVTVTVGPDAYGPYTIAANATKRLKFADTSTGPVRVQGSIGVPLVVTERLAWKVGGNVRTVTEALGLADTQASNVVLFPRYVYNSQINTELLVANIGTGDSAVNFTVGGSTYGPFTVHADETLVKTFPASDAGPVRIEGTFGVPLAASERLNWRYNNIVYSVSELMGFPEAWLEDAHYFTWYGQIPDKWNDTLVRMAMP